jgi:hypothetical protein
MRKHWQGMFAWALILCAAASFLGLAKLSPSYRQCDAEHKQSPRNQETANSQQERARRFIICEGAFFDANKEAVTAAATVAIAAFTLILWLATSRQARLTAETIALTRDEFLASHRPELVIHSVRLLDPQGLTTDPLSVQFGIINAGRSAADITASAVFFDYCPPNMRPYLPELARNDAIPPRRVHVGASDTIIAQCDEQRSDRHMEYARMTGWELFLMGWVVYEDGRKDARTTFFCRQYRRDLGGRFVPGDDPDREKTY